jgi:hypothetical protein
MISSACVRGPSRRRHVGPIYGMDDPPRLTLSPETTMRHPVAFLAILSALACHPPAHSVSEVLEPDSAVEPLVACVRSALAESPNVREAGFKKDYPRTVWVSFVNPPDQYVSGMELVVAPNSGTPTQIVAEYTLWAGTLHRPGVPNLASFNAPAVAAMGIQLLAGVRNQCAPTKTGAPACSTSNFNERIKGRCSIGI